MKTTTTNPAPAKCIYCGTCDATDEFDGLACGCAETPDYMRASAPPVAKRRCLGCGEFVDGCCCGSRHAHH